MGEWQDLIHNLKDGKHYLLTIDLYGEENYIYVYRELVFIPDAFPETEVPKSAIPALIANNALVGIRLKSIAEYDKANFDIDGKTIIRKMFGEDAIE